MDMDMAWTWTWTWTWSPTSNMYMCSKIMRLDPVSEPPRLCGPHHTRTELTHHHTQHTYWHRRPSLRINEPHHCQTQKVVARGTPLVSFARPR
eukprot:4985505-Prymnesium_polylepis.1